MSTRVVGRRAFIRGAGMVGGAVALSGIAGCAKSDQTTPAASGGTINKDAINFVGLYGTSGAQAELGKEAVDGLRLVPALYGGKLAGRRLEVVTYDTQEKIDDAVRRTRESSSAGARFFFGGLLSNVALAVSDEANRAGGLFATAAGADEITGKECRSGTFRWAVATYGAVQETVRRLAEQQPSLRRWYTITPDYVFGQSLLAAAKEVFRARGIEHVGNSFHGLDATEFSGYVNNAVAARPDVLCILNFGAQSTTTIKQAVSFGVKKKMTILLVWSGGLSQFRALGADTMEGIYAGAQYWHTLDTPENKRFVEAFRREHDGANPGYGHAVGYATAKMIADGVQKAGSADPAAVAKALEGTRFAGLTGQETIRAQDHQVVRDYLLLRGRKKSAMADDDDLMELVSRGASVVPAERTGCTLRPLGS
ncbi:branched-chain amino acid ABC transporter substrate-binding protein [Actinomadura soli]|uniref:Branched-chain amino acid ABC transporter substrate-binding protein n=1 Tax=Actinomadura soli TaxID=2508997 RepID=A0A5C4JBS2_9ACTN|nr:ABC transporter substrate-binding protein [Actinomadura soli]TMR00613.1 branched-chain amino acid ABC transporter substrate-binding protein [Actinomadura soli]